jgi:hypothetical protein
MVPMCSAAGTEVNVTKLNIPLASKTLPPDGYVSADYAMSKFSPVPITTGQVNLTVTSGRTTVCTFVGDF